jgi:hypothetical protein
MRVGLHVLIRHWCCRGANSGELIQQDWLIDWLWLEQPLQPAHNGLHSHKVGEPVLTTLRSRDLQGSAMLLSWYTAWTMPCQETLSHISPASVQLVA